MSIPPSEHVARLLEYYIRTLVERSGLRWTEANTADFDQLADLLDQDAAQDTIPPYYGPPIVSDRQTVVLERDPVHAAADEARAGRWRYQQEDDVRRLVRR